MRERAPTSAPPAEADSAQTLSSSKQGGEINKTVLEKAAVLSAEWVAARLGIAHAQLSGTDHSDILFEMHDYGLLFP